MTFPFACPGERNGAPGYCTALVLAFVYIALVFFFLSFLVFCLMIFFVPVLFLGSVISHVFFFCRFFRLSLYLLLC